MTHSHLLATDGISAAIQLPDARSPKRSSQLRLLMAAASPCSQPASTIGELLQSWSQSNWQVLFRDAERHGMWPLLCRYLAPLSAAQIPAAVRDEIERRQRQTALYNLRLTGELWRLLELFAAHGIEAVPIKGPTLAMLAFDDVANRQFCDLDLLIAESDLADCAALLVERGYQPSAPIDALPDTTFRSVINVLEFLHPETGHLVELHWRLSVGFFPLDLSEAWRERRLVETFPIRKRMLTFAAEPLLLYLGVHATKHCWSRLSWAADIAWLIRRRPDLDWDYLFALAHQQHCSRALKLSLALARDWLSVPLPQAVNHAIDQDRTVSALVDRLIHWWTLPGWQAPSPENARWKRTRFFFDIQDDWKSRRRYLTRLLLAPNLTDWKFIRLPIQWSAGYAALRPLRFLLSPLPLIRNRTADPRIFRPKVSEPNEGGADRLRQREIPAQSGNPSFDEIKHGSN